MSVDITVVWLLLAENVCLRLQIKDALTDLKNQNQFRIKVWEKDPSSNNNVITAREHILPLRWFVLQKKLLRHILNFILWQVFFLVSLIRFLFFLADVLTIDNTVLFLSFSAMCTLFPQDGIWQCFQIYLIFVAGHYFASHSRNNFFFVPSSLYVLGLLRGWTFHQTDGKRAHVLHGETDVKKKYE